MGVDLAEDLARALGLPGNEGLADRPRRAKDAMMRRAAAAGLRVPAGASVTSAGELREWLCSAGRSALALRPGSPVRRTVDLFTSPGHVYLISEDPGDLDRDYGRIRELEADGLYRTREGVATSAE